MEGLAYGKAAPVAGNTATFLVGASMSQQCHGLKTKLLTQGEAYSNHSVGIHSERLIMNVTYKTKDTIGLA